MSPGPISATQSQQLKGAAIVLIAVHNFVHLIYDGTTENEIDFDPARFRSLLDAVATRPGESFDAFFTYFGHLGVQVFIFLSAYGLATSKAHIPRRWRFMRQRVLKIYPMFAASIALWLVVEGFAEAGVWGPVHLLRSSAFELGTLLGGVYPFLPGNRYPSVGPWWFVPFIMQVYLAWSLVGPRLARARQGSLAVLFVAGVVINYTLTPWAETHLGVNMLLTPVGHVPELIMGVWAAKHGVPGGRILFVGIPLLAASGLWYAAWPLHHLAAVMVFVPLGLGLVRWAPSAWFFLGHVSMGVFLLNGILRVPLVTLAAGYPPGAMHAVLAILSLCISVAAAWALHGVLGPRKFSPSQPGGSRTTETAL